MTTQETPTNSSNVPTSTTTESIERITSNKVGDSEDFLVGATCNPNNPEECDSCQ